jgi:hypothetical protein
MTGKVAIVTGASQGIGAGLVVGYRGRCWAVVASGRTIKPSKDPDLLTVADLCTVSPMARSSRPGRLANAAAVPNVTRSRNLTDLTRGQWKGSVARETVVKNEPTKSPAGHEAGSGRPGAVIRVYMTGVIHLPRPPRR